MRTLIRKIWLVIRAPDRAFDVYLDEPPRKTILFLIALSTWLAFMTSVTNAFGIPCNLLNSGTNPQLFAYQDIAPAIEQLTGIPRWLVMFPLVLALMMLFVPVVSLFYHAIFKILRGKGSYWHTFRFFVYAGVPVSFRAIMVQGLHPRGTRDLRPKRATDFHPSWSMALV